VLGKSGTRRVARLLGRRGLPARLLASCAALGLAIALVETLAWLALEQGKPMLSSYGIWRSGESWSQSFERLTRADPELGFTLRPGIRSGWSQTEVAINQDGLRDRDPANHVLARRPGESIVLALGDSNTFGNEVLHARTWPARLEARLADGFRSEVRVLNLGVPGYSNLQAAVWLERWLTVRPDARPDVVVFADCFNNRVAGWQETRADLVRLGAGRYWERAGRIWSSLLLLDRLRAPRRLPPLEPEQATPEPRLTLEAYRSVLQEVAASSREHHFSLVFLATGDEPRAEALGGAALLRLRAGDGLGAEAGFAALAESTPKHYVGWHYLWRARQLRGARLTRAEREAYARAGSATGYPTRSLRLAREYIEVMAEVARAEDVPFVDLRAPFRAQEVLFWDLCHYDARGHDLIARAVAEVLRVRESAR